MRIRRRSGEELDGQVDFEGEGWDKKVEVSKPNVEADTAVIEMRELRREVGELKEILGKRDEADGGVGTS